MKKVLLFPGAFNPPHNGHVDALEKALERGSFEEIWIVPSGKRDDKVISTTYEDRRTLGNLFVRFLGTKINIPVKLLTDELDNTENQYTQEILQEIQSRPNVQIQQLIGSDGMSNLLAAGDSTLKNEDFIVIERQTSDVSSTKIRDMVERGDTNYRKFVPTEIGDYIENRGLYKTK